MMGVYIKGMEMPKGIEMLVVFSDGTVHKRLPGMREYVEKGTAVPVRPHGRLVDADAITRAQGFRNYKYENGLMYVEVGEVVSLIKAAPTIIPAEEEE